MKFRPSDSNRSLSRHAMRRAAAIDMLVLVLVVAAMFFWLAGHAFLAFCPQSAGSIGGDDVGAAETKLSSPDESAEQNQPGESGQSGDDPSQSQTPPSTLVHTLNNDREQVDQRNVLDKAKYEREFALLEKQRDESEMKLVELKKHLSVMQANFDNYKEQAQAEQEKLKSMTGDKQNADGLRQQLEDLTAQQVDDSQRHQQAIVALENQLSEEKLRSEQLQLQVAEKIEMVERMTVKLTQMDSLAPTKKEPAQGSLLVRPSFRTWKGRNGRVKEMAFVRKNESGLLIFVGIDDVVYAVAPDHLLPEDLKLIESMNK